MRECLSAWDFSVSCFAHGDGSSHSNLYQTLQLVLSEKCVVFILNINQLQSKPNIHILLRWFFYLARSRGSETRFTTLFGPKNLPGFHIKSQNRFRKIFFFSRFEKTLTTNVCPNSQSLTTLTFVNYVVVDYKHSWAPLTENLAGEKANC